MKNKAQTASDLLGVGLSTEAEALPRLKVMGEYVVTANAEKHENADGSQWYLSRGSIIAELRDCHRRDEYARLFEAAPELLAFVRDYAENADCGDGGDGDACKTGNCWHCSAVQLVRKATGAEVAR